MRIRIDAVDLPGLTCPAPADGRVPEYGNIHVAVLIGPSGNEPSGNHTCN